jgi:aryl-alcohol dehydrogenase-like predicted oxidoreductase
MIYRRLGRTNLEVSLLSLGSGGPNQFGQKAGVPEKEIHRLVHHALDLGINLFDTSPGYGDSELILGRALKSVPRDRYLISTKVALDDGAAGDGIASPRKVVETIENSLRRLQVQVIDILLVAGWPKPNAYERILNETLPEVRKLQQAGKIRFLSASEKSRYDGGHEWLTRGLRDDLFDSVMVAYNVINQSAEREVFPLCQKNDVGTQIIFAVRKLFNNSSRLRDVVRELKRKDVVAPDALPDDDPLGWLVRGDVPSLISAAYKFCAAHPAVSAVMTGTINTDHLEQNVSAVLGPSLPEEDLRHLRRAFGCVAETVGN